VNPDDFRKLAAAGLDTEQIALVMEMMERVTRGYVEAEEARKAKGRERIAKWRLERRNVTVQTQNVTGTLTSTSAPVDDKTLPSEIVSKKDRKVERAARLPENWTLPVEWRADALAAKLPEHLIDLEASKMRDWSQSAPKGVKTNWRPAWRNWCREAAARAGQQARAGPVVRLAPIDHFRNYANEISDGQIRDDRGNGGDWDDAPGVPLRAIQHHG
jgi:hypothetical protein